MSQISKEMAAALERASKHLHEGNAKSSSFPAMATAYLLRGIVQAGLEIIPILVTESKIE